MELKEELLGNLADQVKLAAEALLAASKIHLAYKIELDRAKAEHLLKLKETDPKLAEWLINAKIDVEFEAQNKIDLDNKMAARQAEIAYDYAQDKLRIEEILTQAAGRVGQ